MNDDSFPRLAKTLMKQKHDIIDLFCKTFILSKEPKTIDEIKWILNITMKHLY